MQNMQPNTDIVIGNMVAEWGEIPYAELSVALVYLKVLYEVHQHSHWVARGDSFYGDHLLFQRLYEKVSEEIDQVAEKVIGLGGEENVNIKTILAQMNKINTGMGPVGTIPQTTNLASHALRFEQQFLTVMAAVAESLTQKGMLSRGLDNLLAAIEDVHEGHVYLLQQRIGR